MTVIGIHHLAAITHSMEATTHFYTDILGLRLVKTVVCDESKTSQLYFADHFTSPGSNIVFLAYHQDHTQQLTNQQINALSFIVPVQALSFWEDHLASHGVTSLRKKRFNEEYLVFNDFTGTLLELVARPCTRFTRFKTAESTIPQSSAICGLGGTTLYSTAVAKTAETLIMLGLTYSGEENGILRFLAPATVGNVIEIAPAYLPQKGSSTLPQICWRTSSLTTLKDWQTNLFANGYLPTEIFNFEAFEAIFFNDHGKLLFEIATETHALAILDEKTY